MRELPDRTGVPEAVASLVSAACRHFGARPWPRPKEHTPNKPAYNGTFWHQETPSISAPLTERLPSIRSRLNSLLFCWFRPAGSSGQRNRLCYFADGFFQPRAPGARLRNLRLISASSAGSDVSFRRSSIRGDTGDRLGQRRGRTVIASGKPY